MARFRARDGVWVVYDWDSGPYAISVHESEVSAILATAKGYGKIAFWPFDVPFREAIESWEGRDPIPQGG